MEARVTSALVRFDAARTALAEARSIDEVKAVRDKAEALRLYARQAGESLEMQNDIAEIKIRAERRAGELLKERDQNKGGRPADNPLRVARGFEPEPLSDLGINYTQSHRWQAIADVPEPVFEQHIESVKARGDELTSAGVLRIAKEQRREERREENRALVQTAAPIEVLTFPTIVLDPPWDWGDEGDADQLGRARPTYDTMPLAEIRALPVADLAEPNAHIYLWITNRSLPKGFDLLDAWGFRYITTLTWCKPSIGMGNYYRGSTEQVLFGVRGSLSLLRRDVGTWFAAPRGARHSAKPDAFYQMVETCSPGPWLEMFARARRPGWQAWGAEI